MKLFKTSIWLVAVSLLPIISSCDKIEEGKFLEDTGGKCGQDLPNFPIRKILIEDFTGHTCGNCPRAAETVESLKGIYCDHIVTVAVHMGFFAETESNPDSSYAYDFTTPMGNEIDGQFNIDPTGLPKGMINRTVLDGELLLSYAGWGTAVEALAGLPPDMDIDISNSYDGATRTVTAEVTSAFISNLSGTYNVVVLLTEDSIINWQKDYDLPGGQQDIEFYVHRHVLRNSFTGTWGDEIATGSIATGTTAANTYSMVLPNEWDENKCAVVAYVYETSSNEVVQAEESKIK
ncbi:MAG: Omp28 family outer membrane lipoprotein [Flavobacteriales bacterium]|nr:Omp28 family outer membrane lipoprotein [Flavobacteriales bacterium]